MSASVGSKANPSKFDCYGDLAEDEPYFVIRADDPLSDALIELHAYIGAGQAGAALILFFRYPHVKLFDTSPDGTIDIGGVRRRARHLWGRKR